eukprot:4698320-Pyramimonas_sp.AAC.1
MKAHTKVPNTSAEMHETITYEDLTRIGWREIWKARDAFFTAFFAAQSGWPCSASSARQGPRGAQHAHPRGTDMAATQPASDQLLVARAGQIVLFPVRQ